MSLWLTHRVSLVTMSKGYSLVAVHGFLTVVASLAAEHGISSYVAWALLS